MTIYSEDYPTKEQLLPWQKRGLLYTRTGYGRKIPTTKMILFERRWRRIYCCIFSNVGTNFIIVNKTEINID